MNTGPGSARGSIQPWPLCGDAGDPHFLWPLSPPMLQIQKEMSFGDSCDQNMPNIILYKEYQIRIYVEEFVYCVNMLLMWIKD